MFWSHPPIRPLPIRFGFSVLPCKPLYFAALVFYQATSSALPASPVGRLPICPFPPRVVQHLLPYFPLAWNSHPPRSHGAGMFTNRIAAICFWLLLKKAKLEECGKRTDSSQPTLQTWLVSKDCKAKNWAFVCLHILLPGLSGASAI